MLTPKKYNSVTRIGVTAEFNSFGDREDVVTTASFEFKSIRSFVDWVNQHNPTVAYVTVYDPKTTAPTIYDNWSRTFIAQFIKRGCKCKVVVRLDCGTIGTLTFHKSA